METGDHNTTLNENNRSQCDNMIPATGDGITFEENPSPILANNPLVDLKRVIMSTRTGRDACYRKSSDKQRPPFKVTSTELVGIAEDLVEAGGHDGDLIGLWMTTHADTMSSL